MGWILLILLLCLPVAELTVLIQVGDEIGALSTVGLCILTAVVGLALVRRQGIGLMLDMQRTAAEGRPVGAALVHGAFLLIAGFCLMVPGFLSDAIGFLLLLPPVRTLLIKAGFAGLMVRARNGEARVVIIEGEVVSESGGESAASRPGPYIDKM